MSVADHFGLGNTCVALDIRIDHGFCMLIPQRDVIDVELHHKDFGPIFVVIILQAKLCAAEFAIHCPAPAFGKDESKSGVEGF